MIHPNAWFMKNIRFSNIQHFFTTKLEINRTNTFINSFYELRDPLKVSILLRILEYSILQNLRGKSLQPSPSVFSLFNLRYESQSKLMLHLIGRLKG